MSASPAGAGGAACSERMTGTASSHLAEQHSDLLNRLPFTDTT